MVLVDSVQGKSDTIQFTHGATRTKSKAQDYADEKGITLVDSYEDLLSDESVDAVVLATPHSAHRGQIEAAAAAGKHVFCEKPLTLTKADAEAAIAACESAGVVCATGFNRRFHPAIAEAKALVSNGAMGELMHVEGTMCAPNGMFLAADAWRADKNETPAGGLTPMGVHLIDVYIHLFGEIDEVYCQSFRRAAQSVSDRGTRASTSSAHALPLVPGSRQMEISKLKPPPSVIKQIGQLTVPRRAGQGILKGFP